MDHIIAFSIYQVFGIEGRVEADLIHVALASRYLYDMAQRVVVVCGEDNKDATIAKHMTSFDNDSHAFVQSVFNTRGLNVQSILIEYSLGTDGLWTAICASYIMRNNDIRKPE